MQDDILLQVNKPARYIGGEWNIPKKDFDRAGIKFAICFPDMYEVGMSNLGVRIIYEILNRMPDVVCERFFSVAADFEKALRENNKEIFSLESKRPLKDFDIAGFSLNSELDYTNVLGILESGAVPFAASERDHTYPLLVGGGSNSLNPEPMHEFFDLFIIGEAEEAVAEVIEVYRRHQKDYKSGKMPKEALLLEISRVEGAYVPSFYQALDPSSCIAPIIKGVPAQVKKRFVRDLDSSVFPEKWLVPYIQIVHDRITVEVMRGCPNRCRFCQARSQYWPFRIRSQEKVLELAERSYKCTGYEELSLIGLSVSDYPQIESLLDRLTAIFKPKGVGISIPSVKARANVGRLSSVIASIKKTGLTFAPEAGSKRLRDIMDKDFDESEFFRMLEEAFRAGYQRVKLYFMTGLPGEEKADLDAIVDLAERVSGSRKKVCGSSAFVNVSINTLVPKPHTVFQWLGMDGLERIREKQEYLRAKIRNRRINCSFHDPEMSFIEAILARGDRNLSRVIRRAYGLGAKFDAWSDHFNFGLWSRAFSEEGIDPESYLKEKPLDSGLPWDFIDCGISKESLRSEFEKVVALRRH